MITDGEKETLRGRHLKKTETEKDRSLEERRRQKLQQFRQ